MPPVVAAAAAWYSAQAVMVQLLIKFAISQVISYAFGKVFAPDSGAGSFVNQQSDIKRTFRSSAASRRAIYGEVMLAGPMVYVASTGNKHEFLHMIIALATHEVEAIGDVYIGDRLSTDPKIAGLVRVNKHLGTDVQSADTDLVNEVTQWTAAHKLSGIAYLYVRIKWNQDIWINGIPNIKALVKGKKVYDPRSGLTAWSDNWALCVRDYLTSDYGLRAEQGEIDDAQLASAANISDESVAIVGGSQTRYTCNGIVSLDKTPSQAIEQLLTAGGGSISYSQGQYRVFPAAYTTPTVTLSEDDLRNDITIRPKIPRRELFNAVRGVYVSPETSWEATDFPAVTNPLYEVQDGNQQIFRDIELAYTTDGIRAQRIAKIHLEKSRQGISVDFPAKLTALQVTAMDVIMLSIASMGWINKPFRVTSWTLSADGGVDLTLQEDSAASYDWNLGEATTIDAEPDTLLPDPSFIEAPTAMSLSSGTSELVSGGDGTVISRIKVDWTEPANATVMNIEIQHKLTSDSVWSGSQVINGDATTAWISNVNDGLLYDVRARSVSILGVRSEWIYDSHLVVGKSALPANVASFNVVRQPDGTREFSWSIVNEPDLAGYKIRFKQGAGGTWSTMTDMHTGLLLASPFETNQLAAGDYTLAIKAVDTSGNESVNETIVQSTLGDPRIANSLAVENPRNTGWQGTVVNGLIDANGITAQGNYTWDGLTTWDAWTSWAQNWSTSISYEHTVIDLSAIVTFRPLVSVDAVGSQVIEVAVSDDNIAWGGWHVSTAQETARYIKARITVTNVVEPPQINNMAIIISGDTIEEAVTDSNTATWAGSAATGRTIPIQKQFAVISSVQVALQSVGAGWTWEVLSKNNTAPVIRIYNNGAPADALVDVNIKGIPQ